MRKIVLCAPLVGGLVWGWPAAALAQCGGPDCSGCDVETDCPYDETANCGCDWYEDFESYTPGQMPRVNGWEEWGYAGVPSNPDIRGAITIEIDDHTLGAGGGGKSLKVFGHITATGTDQVRRFYGEGNYPDNGSGGTDDGVGYDIDVSDYWGFKGWVFIPDDHSGGSYFIMNSKYDDTATNVHWPVQVEFDSSRDVVESQAGDVLAELPLIKGEWVQLEIDIDFESDECMIWYDYTLLDAYRWAADNLNDEWPHANALLFLGAIDLFNDDGDDFYYDDLEFWPYGLPPPPPPGSECFAVDRDANGCVTYLWRITNGCLCSNLTEFYLDIEAGRGGASEICRGASTSTTAIDPVVGWTVTNCTNWGSGSNSGHVMFRFVADSVEDELAPGEALSIRLTVDPNMSAEFTTGSTGVVVPPFSVVASVADPRGNEQHLTCSAGDYSFGPSPGANGRWGLVHTCTAFVDIPATSWWAKILLAILLVSGGTLLVLRSGHPAAG